MQQHKNGIAPVLIAIILLACAAAFSASLERVKWFIDDADIGSYAGAAIIMLAVQLAFFSAGAHPRPDAKGFAAAATFAGASAAVLAFGPASLSLGFFMHRLDLLAFALFFCASVVLLFGWEGGRPLRFTLAYSLLAWPAFLSWLAALQGPLTSLTVGGMELFVRIAGLPFVRVGETGFLLPSSNELATIAPQCVALPAFAGFAAFILPIAYFAVGPARRKASWLVSVFAGILMLNLARIAAVMLIWNYAGLGSALSFFHSASGNIMFNGAVALALLAFPFFGLGLPALRGASLFSPHAAKKVSAALADARAELPQFIVPIAALAALAAAFALLCGPVVAPYAWLAGFDGARFVPVAFTGGSLAVPENWSFIASQTGVSQDWESGNGSANATLTQIIFEDDAGAQMQFTALSSADSGVISFNPEGKLASEGCTLYATATVPLSHGIFGRAIAYSRDGRALNSVAWAQPAEFGGQATYGSFILTSFAGSGVTQADLGTAATGIASGLTGTAAESGENGG